MTYLKPDTVESEPAIRLVVGMSRAGTTGMVEALNTHPDVCAFGETKFYGISPTRSATLDTSAIAALNRYFQRILLRLRAPDKSVMGETEALKSAIVGALDALSAPVSRATAFGAIGKAATQVLGKTYWVEKTPHHLMHLTQVFQDDPTARVVVMLRPPEGFMLSYKHQGDRKRESVRTTLHNLYHPLIVSLICRRYLQAARLWRDRAPDQVLVVDLEAVKKDPNETYARVLDHLRLPPAEIAVDAKSNSSFAANGPRPELGALERTWLGLLTNRDSADFGFQPVEYTLRPLSMLWSLADLAVWPIRNASVLLKLRRQLGAIIARWLQ